MLHDNYKLFILLNGLKWNINIYSIKSLNENIIVLLLNVFSLT